MTNRKTMALHQKMHMLLMLPILLCLAATSLAAYGLSRSRDRIALAGEEARAALSGAPGPAADAAAASLDRLEKTTGLLASQLLIVLLAVSCAGSVVALILGVVVIRGVVARLNRIIADLADCAAALAAAAGTAAAAEQCRAAGEELMELTARLAETVAGGDIFDGPAGPAPSDIIPLGDDDF